jgi:succinyl-CoA synthetase alpha subunit
MMQDILALEPQIICLGNHVGIIQSILDYDYLSGRERPTIRAIVAQGRKQERVFWGDAEITLPVYPSLEVVDAQTIAAANCVLNTLSARRVLSSVIESFAVLPALRIVAIFAEQVPERHALQLADIGRQHSALLVGPASVGILVPGLLKLGAIGGTQPAQLVGAGIMTAGDTAVISTSGGMVNELIHVVTGSGLGVSIAMALGGDRYPTLTPADAFLLAEADTRTKRIVYFGELGGRDEYDIAELVRSGKVTKQIIVYIAGVVAELFKVPPQFGHAGAMAKTHDESASAKKEILRSVGVKVLDGFGELAPLLRTKSVKRPETPVLPVRTIGSRKHGLLSSHISGDINGDIQLLGGDLLTTIEQHTAASLLMSMLLGEQVTNRKVIEFTDFVLRLLADHGPYVSGAVNTIVAARAGKDLVSSLAAGLLTVGPRFGGAINAAAGYWLEAAADNVGPREFVASFTAQGGIIPGIGHKKYRIDVPDPRVAALQRFAGNSNGDKYLTFALSVQKVTTAKKGNLILNVDGSIAAILLDLLESELGYSRYQLEGLVDAEFFNALFVLSRSIGFTAHYIDQRRHDEGLLRLSEKDVSYLP